MEPLAAAMDTAPPAYVRGAEKVVVAVHAGAPPSQPSTWPLEPPVRVSADALSPMTDMGCESERTPDAMSDVVATVPSLAGLPLVVVQYERLPATSADEVARYETRESEPLEETEPAMPLAPETLVTVPPPPTAGVDVAMTFPPASTAMNEPAGVPSGGSQRVAMVCCVVEALVDEAKVAKVDEATRESGEPVSQRPVVVAETLWPAYVRWSNASTAENVGHEVRQSVVRQRVVALMAVVEANGNCDAAAVLDAKKTPCVAMEDVVAKVEVAKVDERVNGKPKSAPVFVTVHWLLAALYVVVMPVPLLSVVVATHCGTPEFQARTVPATPVPKNDDVAIAVGAALPAVALARTVLAF